MDGFGTQDIITGRGLGIGGFGFPYGQGYGIGREFANPSANAVRIDATSDRVADQNDFTRELAQSDIEGIRNSFDMLATANEFQTTRKEMTDGFANIANANLQKTIMDGQAALANERRQSDLFMNLNNQINDFRAEAAKCCCDTKILVISENNATRELINTRALEDANRALDQSERSRDTDRIIAAIAANGNGIAKTCL